MRAERNANSKTTAAELLTHIESATPGDLEALARMQVRVAESVVEQPLPAPPRVLCGIDLAYKGDRFVAAAIAIDAETGDPIESFLTEGETVFPYMPGYLAYRETLPALKVAEGLRTRPDIVFYDGNGKFHPRRCGAACYLGVVLGIPVIGVSKSPPKGADYGALGKERGSRIEIDDSGLGQGAALRTQTGVKPIFVSVGNLISLSDALRITLEQSKFRVPDPIRRADRASRKRDDVG